MSDRPRRVSGGLRVALGSAVLLSLAFGSMPVHAAHQATGQTAYQRHLERFLWGLAGQESGWNYYARNVYSGAFGKYQIMPVNWDGWAAQYVTRDGWVDESPANQEVVARGKITDLYEWLGTWRRVAYWWLSGLTNPDESYWSERATRYVNNVTALMKRAPKDLEPPPVDVADGPQVQAGDWRLVVDSVRVRDGVASKTHVARTKPMRKLTVTEVEQGPKKVVLWLQVTLPSGKAGWINAKRTLPAQAPPSSETEAP